MWITDDYVFVQSSYALAVVCYCSARCTYGRSPAKSGEAP
jgi:hypothetical protein